MRKTAAYICRRLSERSTYLQLSQAVVAAMLFPPPWCYVTFGIAALGIIIADGPIDGPAPPLDAP